MINLRNDYNSVAHPAILEALSAHQDKQFPGYGTDEKTEAAKEAVLQLFGDPAGSEVYFIPGGTLTNLIAISSFLRPHEAVIAPRSSHIFMHETGAIEATGHKLLTVKTNDGKLRPEVIRSIVDSHTSEHMVRPRLVYISQTTELGTVYTCAELEALRSICDELDLLLYIDGARLAYAATATCCDLDLPKIAELADAFYLGGTKAGLLFGEALVIGNPSLQMDFRHLIKQRGGLLAKGFLLGIQFIMLLDDGMFLRLAAQANVSAARLYEGLGLSGYTFAIETESNQVFPIIEDAALAKLSEYIDFEVWEELASDKTAIRFVTTWQTTEDEIQAVLKLMS